MWIRVYFYVSFNVFMYMYICVYIYIHTYLCICIYLHTSFWESEDFVERSCGTWNLISWLKQPT